MARAQSVTIEYSALVGSVQDVVISGLDATRRETVLELLPRRPPARYSDQELREFERRLANLGIFDRISVTRTAATIDVDVREKWTLIPLLDFSTGTSWADTYAALSVTEYNFMGRAMLLSADVWHAERGWNGALLLSEHAYHPERGSLGGVLDYASSSMVFDDSSERWDRLIGGGGLWWRPPLPHGDQFAYQVMASYHYERNLTDGAGFRPHDGHALKSEFRVTWEDLHWDDLAPHGSRAIVMVMPGGLFHPGGVEPRIGAELQLMAAHAFGATSVLMGRVVSKASSRGNANFSAVLASVDGVRGVPDAVYHTWLSGVANLELRQAWRFAERWALQGVAFGDIAAFDRIDVHGQRTEPGWAASAGLGVRLVPTFLAEVVLRIDVARCFWPRNEFFVQWGLSQYF